MLSRKASTEKDTADLYCESQTVGLLVCNLNGVLAAAFEPGTNLAKAKTSM